MTTIENTKKCTGECGRELPATLEYFYKQKNGKFGLYSECKVCFNKRAAKYNQTPAGKKAKAKYAQTPAGKKVNVKAQVKYAQTDAGKRNGAKTRNSPVSFKTYAPKLELTETVKKASDGKLLVACKKCGKFFKPTKNEVTHRLAALDGRILGESNFYCSQKCKDECGTFQKRKFAVGDPNAKTTARVSTDPEVVIMVLEREDGKCEICESTDRVEVHHYIGAVREPMLTNDPDNLHALCHLHHKKITKACGISYTRRPACNIKQ